MLPVERGIIMTHTVNKEKRGSFWLGILTTLRRMPIWMSIICVLASVFLSPLLIIGAVGMYIFVKIDDITAEHRSTQ